MKSILTLLLFSVSSAFSQLALEFPENLLFDPYDYKIARLEFKEVIQYKTWDNVNTDSSGGIPIEFSLQYVVAYDSLQQISSYKFDFKSLYHWQYLAGPTIPAYQPKPIKDSTHYFFYNYKDSLYSLVFQNYIFQYDDRTLSSIELHDVHKPNFGPIAGVLDGIYYEAAQVIKETTELTYDFNYRLIQNRIISDDGKIELWQYYYEQFTDGDNDIYLLNRAELDIEGAKLTYHIEYRK